MREYTLPRKTLLLWCIRIAILAVVLFALCLFLCRFAELFRFVAIAIPFIFAAVIIFYLPALFKSCKISFVNDAVIVKRGVFIENCHILPFSRMIYAQTLVTPLARLLGLEAITLKAARSRIFIPELEYTDAKSLLEQLGGEV